MKLSLVFTMKNTQKIRSITLSALIAALYTALTLIAAALGFSSGVIQVRISEALTVLPYFTSAAISGLTVGCFISNLLTGGAPADILLGTAATLVAAIFTRLLRKAHPMLSPLPPIVVNTLTVPWILRYGYGLIGGIPYFMLTVGIGELISCGVLGLILLYALKKRSIFMK